MVLSKSFNTQVVQPNPKFPGRLEEIRIFGNK